MKKLITSALVLALVMTILPVSFTGVNAYSNEIENVRVAEYNTSARISWETRDKALSRVYYGTNPDQYETLIKDETRSRDHLLTLKALDPDTTYYYKIVSANSSGNQIYNTYEDSLRTTGTRQSLIVYQNYFTLLFDNYWKNINGKGPSEINDPLGLNFAQEGFVGNALKVDRTKSYLEYTCENNFSSGYGAVTAWISFDTFNKSAVIWQTDDSRYALYYEVGGSNSDFDKRIVARAGGNVDGEYPEAEYILDPDGSALNKWGVNEWHFIAMVWEGEFNGTVELYIDGRRVDQAHYEDATGCSTFRIGNSYRDYDNMNFSIGKIDEFKMHEWAMPQQYVYQNYLAYSTNPKFAKKGTPEGQVAGVSVRYFKNGSLIKAPNGAVYIIVDDKKMHVSDTSALNRLRPERLVNATWQEVDQYLETADKFEVWSRYPHGSLLKERNSKAVYYLGAEGKLHLIPNEYVFYKYGNEWKDVITISPSELAAYEIGQPSE